ncbi:MAG: hypothetical protein RBJ76_00070 (plasmid) [Stenomitos frigidus ULC029]
MSKPLGYYADPTDQMTALAETFGSQLEVLSLTEKLHLLGVLAMHQQVVTDKDYDLADEEYFMSDAYADHTFADETGKLTGACESLQGARNQDLRGLMLALANQIATHR